MRNKIAGVVLCAALTSLALTGMAFAATGGFTEDKDGTVTYDKGAYTYTATYTDQAYAGKQAAIVVVRGTEQDDGTLSYTLSDKTITYIDQKAISDDGSISFTFIPRSQPDSLVLLGIEGTDAPVLVGKIIGQGVTVSGTVTLQGRKASDGASLTLSSSGENYYAVTGNDGKYTFDGVNPGEYTLTVEKDGYLLQKTTVSVEDAVEVPAMTLYGGDINADAYINGADLSLLLGNFGTAPGTAGREDRADINGDTYVNGGDLSLLLSNFGKNAK